MFYLHIEILQCGYYWVHLDIIVFTAVFCKRLHLDSSTYLRVTSALSSNYQQLPSRIVFRHISFSDVHFELCDVEFLCYLLNDQSVRLNVIRDDFRWYFDDNANVTRRSRKECSINQRRVCFIRGEEFQRVGRTIFIE